MKCHILLTIFAVLIIITGCSSSPDQKYEASAVNPGKENKDTELKKNKDGKYNLSLEECLKISLRRSYEVSEAIKRVEMSIAKYEEVKGNLFPKLGVNTLFSVMPELRGNAVEGGLVDFWDFGGWGPFTTVEATLILPIYTFGKIDSGKRAAQGGIDLARAQKKEIRNNVAVMIKQFYYGYLYAFSMKKVLDDVDSQLSEALKYAKEEYNKGTGKVSKADLSKLEIGSNELIKNKNLVKKMLDLTKSALAGYLGIKKTDDLQLTESKIKKENVKLKPLKDYKEMALKHNPQWEQLQAGLKATKSLIGVEESSHLPIIFLAGMMTWAWAPSVDDQPTFARDPFNTWEGGAAVGARWEFDLQVTNAKIKQAQKYYESILEKEKYARQGIPLLVHQNYAEIEELKDKIKLEAKSLKSAKKWMIFSAAGFMTGTGEAKDALEGLVAFATYNKNYYEAIFNYNMALAQLSKVVGKEITDLKY